jgi:trk system potassium uptake protein TrkA
MKQIGIIGLGSFGKRVLEELIMVDCEIILIDKDSELIDFYKDQVTSAYIADVINEETIKKLIPVDLDSVILDLGERIEASILAANYLKKMGSRNVIVKAESDPHGEILELVGVDHVIYPDREAARRITPMIVSELLFNFTPISNGMVMAEVRIPTEYVGQTLIQANIRQNRGINVVAMRKAAGGDFTFFSPEYMMTSGDIFLVVGSEEDIMRFAGATEVVRKKSLTDFFRKIFKGKI